MGEALSPISPRVREKFLNGKGLGRGPSPPADPRLREIFSKGYDREVGDCPTPDIDAIKEAIKLSNNSSPGPDGISFAAWRAAPDLAAPVLHNVLSAIMRGHTPPEGFNHGLLFLLPKKLTGLVSDTRPLSVTNTDNRLLAATVARAIMPSVVDLINPSQKGSTVATTSWT